MNDTIMASVAALKSTNQNTSYSLYTGFRSVRSRGPLFKASRINQGPAPKTEIVAIQLDRDVAKFFRDHSDDHMAHIRSVLRKYVHDQS